MNRLHSTPLADSLRTWYIYREKACKEIHNTSFYDMGNMQCLWFNRNIRSRTKQYLFYEDWYEKGIQFISDLLNPPPPGSKLFEELVLDFDVSKQDRRKFNFLMKCIPSSWLQDSNSRNIDLLILLLWVFSVLPKFPSLLIPFLMKLVFQKTEWIFGKNLVMLMMMLKILTGMRSISGILSVLLILVCDPFKIFHKAIAFNDFLFKINRRNSPNCNFCDKFPESIIHIFCECDFVRPIWEELFKII